MEPIKQLELVLDIKLKEFEKMLDVKLQPIKDDISIIKLDVSEVLNNVVSINKMLNKY